MKRLVLALSAVALLAACQRNEDKADAPPAPEAQPQAEVTPADQAAPLTFEQTTDYAEVKLELPPSITAFRDLHATLYGEGVADLRRFVDGAQSAQTEYGGEDGAVTYSRELDWTPQGETARLYSLARSEFEFTGGAHPNTTYSAVLWDKGTDRRLAPTALFRPGADMGVLDRALCQAINAARTARTGEASALTVGGTDWACPRAVETPFALAASRTAGKAGGLVFLISPYAVGPYAEGAYWVVVPQAAFRSLVAQEYAAEFGGEPARAGDVTPQA